MSNTRDTLPVRIERQFRKLAALDARLGRLMTQRVDEEEKLAELLRLQNGLSKVVDTGSNQP